MLVINPIHATTPDNTLVMAWRISEMSSLDPAEAFSVADIEYVANTYDRLVAMPVNHPENIKGALAKSWEITGNGRIYTFTLKDNLRFASGNSITSSDVVYSLQRLVLLNRSPAFILNQFGFKKDNINQTIRQLDDKTVVLTTDKPYAPSLILSCLSSASASIVDQKTLVQHAKDDWGNDWLKTHYAGSGPYTLTKWLPNDKLMLAKNSNYWGDAAKIDNIIIKHVQEKATQELLLRKGDADIARNISPTLKDVRNIKLLQVPDGGLFYLAMNQSNPYLKIPQVREALKWLIDYEGIIKHLETGKAQAHQTIIPNGFLGAINKRPYHLNVEKAKALLREVNLEKGFTIKLETTRAQIGQVLQAQFARANITLKIIPGDDKQLLTKYKQRKHELLLALWGVDYFDPHANTSTFSYNVDNSDDTSDKTLAWRNHYSDEKTNALVQQAFLESDTAKRIQLYHKLQEKFLKEGPFAIIFQRNKVIGLQDSVNGFVTGPLVDSTRYQYITKKTLS